MYIRRMKLFCHIFALYLLALACVPCNDGEHEHQDEGDLAFIEMTGGDADHSHSDCADYCSPFCQCSCCGTLTISTEVEELSTSLPVLVYQAADFLFHSPITTAHHQTLDRPPIS
ncbi:MAG: hypothetical protein K9I85_12075 [Saprospiraceae bacterium]|nr:hypothetical protein [Saprospiraceae bacterium]